MMTNSILGMMKLRHQVRYITYPTPWISGQTSIQVRASCLVLFTAGNPDWPQTSCLSAPWHLFCYRIPYGIFLNSFQVSCSFACSQLWTGPPLGLVLLAVYFTEIFSECYDMAGCLPWFPVWTQIFPYIYILLAISMENLMPNSHLEIFVSHILYQKCELQSFHLPDQKPSRPPQLVVNNVLNLETSPSKSKPSLTFQS